VFPFVFLKEDIMKEGEICSPHSTPRCALLQGRVPGRVRVWSLWDKLRWVLFG
jgi:hypothetical protein